MELDKYKNDGRLLLGTDSGLLTTDGQTTSTLVSFNVKGFTQLNTAHVVLADFRSHCIKLLTREDNNINVVAGSCGTSGYKEGGLGVGQLSYPWGVQIDVRNPEKLLVTDQNNNALRSVDIKTGELSTVINTGFNTPRGFLWAGRQLLVANRNHYISQVSWSSNGTISNTLLAGSTSSGDVIGSFEIARIAYPYDIEEVTDNLFLVAEGGNRKLKLMDMKKRIVGPVCFKGEDPCTESSLFPDKPSALLNVGEAIYVGMYQKIFKLSGEYYVINVCRCILYNLV